MKTSETTKTLQECGGLVKKMNSILTESIPLTMPEKLAKGLVNSGKFKKEANKFWKAFMAATKVLALEFLALVEEGIVVAATTFKVKDFFRHCSGTLKLYIHDNFKNWILDNAPETAEFAGEILSKFKLTKNMYDSEICKELGDSEPFTIAELLGILRSLIEKQPNGKEGTLLNNGYANIFYVKLPNGKTVAVGARWDSDDSEWHLFAWEFDDDDWHEGNVAFSRS